MQYIDLTQTFTSDMPVYPGDSADSLHVGTHMDAPLHMIAGGKKISELDPEKFFGPGKIIDARGKEKIDASLLTGIEAGDIVLVLTGFGQKFRDPDYFEKYPELTEDFANKLVELKVKMVGADTPSPDRPPFAVHKILLGNEILILENLTNLEKLLNQKFEVTALPQKLETDAALTRVIAKII